MSDFTSMFLVTAVRFLQQQQNVTATATDGGDSSTDMMSPGPPPTGVFGSNSPVEETVAPNMNTDITSEVSNHSAFEFIAFIMWYLFLVLCCIIPTCCAYRRRRLMGQEYSQRQQAARNIAAGQYPSMITVEQLQQLQRMPHGLLLLNSLQRQDINMVLRSGSNILEGDVAKAERTKRLKEFLDTTTFIVTQNDILQNNNNAAAGTTGGGTTSSNEEPNGANDATTSEKQQQQQEEEEEESDDGGLFLSSSLVENALLLQLPHDTDQTQYVNANRTVPGVCAICLCEYEANDEVTWSKETGCQHAFHQDCIVPWLAKKNDAQPKCPCCRQVYAQIQPLTLMDVIDSNNNGSNIIEVGADGTPVTTTTNTATIHDTPRWSAGSLTALTPFQLDFIMRTGGSSFFPDDEEQQQQQQLQSGGVALLDEDGGGGDDRENNNDNDDDDDDDDQEGTRPSSSSAMDLEMGRDIETTGGVDESDNNDNNYIQRRTEQ
jgi:hypothetical protein